MGLSIDQQGDIIIYTFTDFSDESIDTWALSLEGLLSDVPDHQPFYVLVNVAAEHGTFSGRARKKRADLFPRFQSQTGYAAFIYADVTASDSARNLLSELGLNNFTVAFFDTQAAGLQWLRSQRL